MQTVFSSLVDQLAQFIELQQFHDALRQLDIVLAALNQASVSDCERILKLIHPLAKDFISQQNKGDADKLYKARETVFILENQAVSALAKREFYQKEAEVYAEYVDYFAVLDDILINYNQALTLGRRCNLSREIDVINKALEQTLICAWYYYALPLIESQIEEINSDTYAEITKNQFYIKKLVDALIVYENTKLSSAIYTKLKPFYQKHLELFVNKLHINRQKSLAAYIVVVDETQLLRDQLIAHGQYDLAAEYCRHIITNATKKALEYPKAELLMQIEKIGCYKLDQANPAAITFYPDWLQRKEQLAAIREKVSGSLTEDFIKAQRNYTKDIKAFINKISASCVEMLGKAPCGFTLLGIGSIARDEMSMYSDLDCALLIANQAYREHIYFQNYIKLLKVHLDLLGEQQQVAPGLRIDSGDLAHFENLAFVDTAAGYIARYNPANLDPNLLEAYAIHRPISLYNSEDGVELLQEYRELLAKTTDAKALGRVYLEVHKQQYQGLISYWNKENKVDIKDRYIRYMSLWLTDIALYFGIDKLEPLAILGELAKQQIITADFIQKYQAAYVELHKLRWKLQQASGLQDDSLADEGRIKYLTELDTKVVQIAYKSTSRLLERLAGEEINPAQVVLEQLLAEDANNLNEASYHLFYQCLLQVNDFQKAQSYCQEFSINLADMETRASLLKVFASYKTQQAQIFKAIVERIPERDGSRVCIEQEKQRLVAGLWELTTAEVTRQPLTVVDITSYRRYERYLPVDIAGQLIVNGDFKSKLDGQGGRHVVLPTNKDNNKLWWKLYPEQPGNCYAWEQLSWKLVGSGTIMSTVVKLKLKNKQTAAIQVLQDANSEELLSKVLENNPEKLSKLSRTSFTQQFIRTIILNPEDDKADDYYLKKDIKGNYNLLRIDNDRALFDAEQKGKWRDWSSTKLLVKSIIFCLDQMTQPLDEGVVKDFLQLNPYLLLKSWLQELQQLHSVYKGLFTQVDVEAHFNRTKPGNSLLTVMIPEVQIKALNNRIIMLQIALKCNAHITGQDVLQNVQPSLADYYLKMFKDYPIKSTCNQYALRRFVELTRKLYGLKKRGCFERLETHITSMEAFTQTLQQRGKVKIEEMVKIWQGYANAPKQCLALLNTANADQETYSLEQIAADVLIGKYQGFMQLSISMQVFILRRFKRQLKKNPQTYLERSQINILHCIELTTLQIIKLSSYNMVLTDKILTNIMQNTSEQLLQLDVSDCKYISDKFLPALAMHCTQIRKLYARNLLELVYFEAKEWFFLIKQQLVLENLCELDLSGCSSLTTIDVYSPCLRKLMLNGCGAVERVETHSVELAYLDISYCKNLTDEAIKKIAAMDLNRINTIKLKGCSKIKYADFLDKYPHLKELPDKLSQLDIAISSEYLLKLVEIYNSIIATKPYGEPSIMAGPFGQEFLTKETEIISGLALLIDQNINASIIMKKLLKMVLSSKYNKECCFQSSNAISILNLLKYPFSGLELSGISIPGADLLRAKMKNCNLSGADLTGVRLIQANLAGSNFKQAQLGNVVFGERILPSCHTASITNIACAPDESTFATASCDNTVYLWEGSTMEQQVRMSTHTTIWCITYSPDSKTIAMCGSDHAVRLLDVASRATILTIRGHDNWVRSIAYSPDGNNIVTGSYDKSVRIWDTNSGKELRVLQGHQRFVMGVSYSPDGTKVASCSEDNTAIVWDINPDGKKRSVFKHEFIIWCIAFSPDGKTLATASGDSTVKLLDLATSNRLHTLKGHTQGVKVIQFSRDGKFLASGSADCIIKLWEVASGNEICSLYGHTDSIRALAFTFVTETLVTGGADTTIRQWDVKRLKALNNARYKNQNAELLLNGADFHDAIGLSYYDANLLKQGGALNVPTKVHSEHRAWPKYDPAAIEEKYKDWSKNVNRFFQPVATSRSKKQCIENICI